MNRITKSALLFGLLTGCIDEPKFNAPNPSELIIIEGYISDLAGGYTVKISEGRSLNADSSENKSVEGAEIFLYDDTGNSEAFNEVAPGRYKTPGAIQGTVGHSYHIRVILPTGDVFESEPEKINPVGEITEIRPEFEARTVSSEWGETDANVFNVFVDALAGEASEKYVRWRFTGTYKVDTYPELYLTWTPPYTPYKDPRPCSGYIVVSGPEGSGGLLEKIGDCTCCQCWVRLNESIPQLYDTQLIQGGEFKNIKVGEVPINGATFYDKFLIEVEQMSLTRTSFNFFSLIKNQKENASSLFQPPAGELIGNIKQINSDRNVIGLFWATSLRVKTLFLDKKDVPYPIPPDDPIFESCYDVYPNASNIKHPLW